MDLKGPVLGRGCLSEVHSQVNFVGTPLRCRQAGYLWGCGCPSISGRSFLFHILVFRALLYNANFVLFLLCCVSGLSGSLISPDRDRLLRFAWLSPENRSRFMWGKPQRASLSPHLPRFLGRPTAESNTARHGSASVQSLLRARTSTCPVCHLRHLSAREQLNRCNQVVNADTKAKHKLHLQ